MRLRDEQCNKVCRILDYVLANRPTERDSLITAVCKAFGVLETEPQWIPVKTRPMTQEEREYYELHWDADLDDDEAVLFDCPMPEDKQTIWVTTKNGYLFQDTCENDDGYIGLEGNGDWYDIVAWMPVLVPEPYKESKR